VGVSIELPQKAPSREFCAWGEDWEVVSLRKNDPVDEQKILNKYGDMVFRDPSDGEIYMIDSDNLVWEAGCCGGWAIKAFAADSEGDDDFEVFKILEKN